MPYIITTASPDATIPAHEIRGSDVDRVGYAVSRTAVATLDEARNETVREVHRHDGGNGYGQAATFLPGSGGAVGPLPDGTVIEVRYRSTVDLCHDAGVSEHDLIDTDVVAAFNAS